MTEDELNDAWEGLRYSPEERLVFEQKVAERRREWAEYLADTIV